MLIFFSFLYLILYCLVVLVFFIRFIMIVVIVSDIMDVFLGNRLKIDRFVREYRILL
jgi:hypothetical protein